MTSMSATALRYADPVDRNQSAPGSARGFHVGHLPATRYNAIIGTSKKPELVVNHCAMSESSRDKPDDLFERRHLLSQTQASDHLLQTVIVIAQTGAGYKDPDVGKSKVLSLCVDKSPVFHCNHHCT
jgi:hypothetical protein